MKKFARYWAPVYVCMILIAYFSLSSNPPSRVGGVSGITLNFNLLHLVAYFILCFFVVRAAQTLKLSSAKRNPFLFSIFYCFIFGCLIEFLQSFIPNRSTSLVDVLYNTSSIFFYPLSIMVVRNIKNKQSIFLSS